MKLLRIAALFALASLPLLLMRKQEPVQPAESSDAGDSFEDEIYS
jgi:hypothetical protein